MGNTIITPSIIAREALFQLENNCVAADLVHRAYKEEFVKIGESVTVRRPVKFQVTTGVTRVNQNVTEQSDSITIDQRKHVSWSFSSQELTMRIEEYSERYIRPAMIQLGNEVDVDVLTEGYTSFWQNSEQTTGDISAINTFDDLGAIAQRMDENAIPDDGNRCVILNPAARWGMSSGLQAVFNADITGDVVRKGKLGHIAGLDIYGDQNIRAHTVGDYGGTPLTNGAVVAAGDTALTSAVVTDGWTASQQVLNDGDIITIAGASAINPVSRDAVAPARLQHFVVVGDVTSDGGGNATVTVSPAIRAAGAYQTVTALPADNAAITVLGTATAVYAQNLAFHRNAIALVTCPLELPDSVTFKARANWRGLSIRVVKDYDINNDEEIIRLDIFYGTKAIYPDLGVRAYAP